MPHIFQEGSFPAAAIGLIVVGAVIGGSIGLVVIGFPGAIASAALGAFCGVVLTDALE
jgi:hypothetical protein